MTRILGLAAAILLVVAAPALAVPGDPLPENVSPANGATTPAGQAVTLVFTCPEYRQSPSEETPTDRFAGYGVAVSTDPTFAKDAFGSEVVRGPGPGQCSATPRELGRSDPLTAPGTYYWRVSRSCFCEGASEEVGPTSSFTIAAARSRMTLAAPKRPYAGYGFLASLSSDLPDGTEVAAERRRGSGWVRVPSKGTIRVSDGRASAPVTLGRGGTSLRWIVTAGGQSGQTSPPVAVSPRRATGWSTGRADDGRYRGSGRSLTTLRVAKRGREIRDFRAQVTTFCIGSPTDPAQNRLVTSLAIVKRIKVAPDGRFLATVTVSETDLQVSGRLRNRRVSGGRVSVVYPLCSGARSFSARRR